MKKVIAVIVIFVLILAIIWIVYESVKPEPVSISATNELPNENMGLDNIINDIFENETNTTNENEIVNETAQNNVDEDKKTTENDAKKYYEEEYGSTDEIYFSCEEINGDGRYIVRVGTAGQGMNMFLLVNIDNGKVTEK